MSDPKLKDTEDKTGTEDNSGSSAPVEIGGRKGLDPTRYGDWEIGGKCVDF